MTQNESILSFCLSFLSNENNNYNKQECMNILESVTSIKNENLILNSSQKFSEHELEKNKLFSSLGSSSPNSSTDTNKMTDKIISRVENFENLEKGVGCKNFKCTFEDCEKSFDYKWILDRHINSHFCFKLYKCEYGDCSKAYKSKENLNLHFRNKHLGEKPYQCRFCFSRFSHRNGKFKILIMIF
jgi:uncharacterized Zn-finger protein